MTVHDARRRLIAATASLPLAATRVSRWMGPGALALPLTAIAPGAAAQSAAWPNRPVRLLVGSPAGSGTDLVARAVAARMGEPLGQPLVTENRMGAGGQIATEVISKATPDGYMLLALSSAHASQAATLKSLPYDPIDGLRWVSTVGVYPLIIATAADSPIRDLDDLIRRARQSPGSISYSTSGIGSALHLIGEWLGAATGTQLTHVPYPAGGGFGYTDLIAGRIQLMINIPGLIVPNIRAGKLRAIAVSSPKRYDVLPDVPTLSEIAPGLEIISWLGIVAPPATPPDIVTKINAAVRSAIAQPELQEQLRKAGVTPQANSPDEFRAVVAESIDLYRKIARSRGIELQ